MNTPRSRLSGALALIALLATASLPLRAQTLIHYRLNSTDATAVATGSVPNAGTLGAGITGGTGTIITLSSDIPTNGVPPDAGNRSINGGGTGGVRAPGTQQLNRTNIANAGGFTYEAWFKWNGSGNFNAIIDYAGTEKLVRLTGQPGPAMNTSDGGSFNLIGAAAANEWHYVAAVFTPLGPVSSGSITGHYSFYLDNNTPVSFASNVVISAFGDSLIRTIGVAMHPEGFADNYFNGLIYEPRVTLGAVPAHGLLFKPRVIVTNTNNAGAGSLRDAAATAPNGAVITFAPTLSGQTITLTNEIVLNNNVAIDANSLPGGITISGGKVARIFYVNGGQTVSLLGLTFTGGNGVGTGSIVGGAIRNQGTLTLTRCTLSGNSASGGGAIDSTAGTLTLTHCTLSGNSASSYGGAIANGNFGTKLTLIHCTLAFNHSAGGGGGAIDNYFSATLILSGCILAGNTATTGIGPDLWMESGTLNGNNCLIGNGANSFVTNGVNGNLVGTSGSPINALLAPLGHYGGSTPTMPPLLNSPAIDAAGNTGLTTDQRGFPRPVGLAADIGAVEPDYNLSLVVTNQADNGAGSLRQTILNALPGTITFSSNLSGATITLTNGELLLDKSLTIDATSLPGGITVSGGNISRIFYVDSGQTVSLVGLTLTGGNGVGAIANGFGGAVENAGTLTMTRCTISGNSAGNFGGGAIANGSGVLALTQCTLSGNDAYFGGASYNFDGTFSLTNCTLSGNSARFGGAIINNAGGLSLTHCTLALNHSTGTVVGVDGGGGIRAYGFGALTLTACILAGNTDATGTGPDVWLETGTLTATHCLVGDGANSSITNGVSGNLVGTSGSPINPLLAPLGSYGGPTRIMPPLPGSSAIDNAGATGLTADQRGFPRPVGLAADIGAVEPDYNLSLVVTNQADNGAGSLRQTILNALPGTITFSTNLSSATILLTSGELVLDKNIAIDASALPAGITISGGNASRIFYVNSGQTVSLSGLSLTSGNAAGAISSGYGGAIDNRGTLALTRCTLAGNNAALQGGGAIANDFGTLALTQCTLSGNSARFGGASYNFGGTLSLTNCTLSANTAVFGGALLNNSGGLTLTHCTLAFNHSIGTLPDFDGGGGIRQYNGGALTLTASLLASNTDATGTGPDFWLQDGTVNATRSLIGNGNNSMITNGVNGNIVGTNAMLASLGNYGGSTQTTPPLPGSPAIDTAGATGLAIDQRGYPRPIGLAADIGAVEGIYNAAGPGKIISITRLANGSVQFSFTNLTDAIFPVLATTNLSQSLSNWTQIGFATETPVGSGQFQFTDPQAPNNPQRFYRVRTP